LISSKLSENFLEIALHSRPAFGDKVGMETDTTTPAEVFRTAVARDQANSDELLAAYQSAKAGRSLADLGAVELRRACRKHEIWTAFELRREAALAKGTRHPAVTRAATRTTGEIGYLLEMYRTASRSERPARWADVVAWCAVATGWAAATDGSAICRRTHTGARGKDYWQWLRRDSWTWTLGR
jgi:hypothetical protein